MSYHRALGLELTLDAGTFSPAGAQAGTSLGYAGERQLADVLRASADPLQNLLNTRAAEWRTKDAFVYTALRSLASKVGTARLELNRLVTRLADWSDAQLAAIERGYALLPTTTATAPAVSEIVAVRTAGPSNVVRLVDTWVSQWNQLVGSLRARGKLRAPQSAVMFDPAKFVGFPTIVGGGAPPPPPPLPDTSEEERRLQAERERLAAEYAELERQRAAELERQRVEAPEAVPSEPLVAPEAGKIPWLWIGAGVVGLGVVGYLIVRK